MDANYMFYREMPPPDGVSHLAWSFWEFRVDESAPAAIRHEVFPDGCTSIFYYANRKYGFDGLGFNGLSLETLTTEVFPGNFYWGVRLSPPACAAVLNCDPATLESTPNFALPGVAAGLKEQLGACGNFEEAINVFTEKLLSLRISPGDIDGKVAKAVRFIEAAKGEAKISEIAEELDLSTRQLQRLFRKNTGLTPKQFTRARRIRAAAVNLVENNELSWANRAAEIGFADQSHLTHEFTSLTGRSPNSFAEKVNKIDHGKLV